jgi:cytochrome c556
MTRTLPFAALSLALLAGAALAAATPSPMPQVQAQMKAVVDKASTDLFNTAGAADPANGPDQQLPDTAGWTRIKADADKLKAVADWLQDPKNGKPAAAWMKAAQSMSALSAAASKAAAAHDAKGLAQAANDLSDTCTACHSVYKKQS